jgi:hypothetical protein
LGLVSNSEFQLSLKQILPVRVRPCTEIIARTFI